jgi:hypothetical protein
LRQRLAVPDFVAACDGLAPGYQLRSISSQRLIETLVGNIEQRLRMFLESDVIDENIDLQEGF